MKKVSALTILCVSLAYAGTACGAASVRSLGGAGTYNSASSASSDAAAKNATGTSSAASSVRAGSMRVTSASNKTGTATKATAGSTSTGRAASGQRLSIGRYLGSTTSGNQTTSSTGGMMPGTATSGDVADLQKKIDELVVRIEGMEDVSEEVKAELTSALEELSEKQDVLVAGEYIGIENNEIFVNVDSLREALGTDEIEMQVSSDGRYLQYKYIQDSVWTNVLELSDITGDYVTNVQLEGDITNITQSIEEVVSSMDQKIQTAIAAIDLTVFYSKEEIDEKLSGLTGLKEELGALAYKSTIDGSADFGDKLKAPIGTLETVPASGSDMALVHTADGSYQWVKIVGGDN